MNKGQDCHNYTLKPLKMRQKEMPLGQWGLSPKTYNQVWRDIEKKFTYFLGKVQVYYIFFRQYSICFKWITFQKEIYTPWHSRFDTYIFPSFCQPATTSITFNLYLRVCVATLCLRLACNLVKLEAGHGMKMTSLYSALNIFIEIYATLD